MKENDIITMQVIELKANMMLVASYVSATILRIDGSEQAKDLRKNIEEYCEFLIKSSYERK